jgi:hypothetical protein
LFANTSTSLESSLDLTNLYSQIRYTVPFKNEFRHKNKAGHLKRIALCWFNLASSYTLCAAGFFAPLPLPVLSSRPPQLQSCAELIQLLLSSGSGAAFLLAGANSSGARRRCCASSSLSSSITAPRPENQTEVSQTIRERSWKVRFFLSRRAARTVGDEVDADGELPPEHLHLGLLGLELPHALLEPPRRGRAQRSRHRARRQRPHVLRPRRRGHR